MTRDVVRIDEDMPARDALRTFRTLHIRHAPVLHDGRLAGIVTDHDLMQLLPGLVREIDAEEQRQWARATVGRAMTSNPSTVRPNDLIDDAVASLLDEKMSGLPVVKGDELLGILTSADVFRAFSTTLAAGDGERITLLSGLEQKRRSA